MFEKISGFFKQFTSRRKRQSGETTIMEGKEPSADEFGMDEEFGLDSFGDTGETEDSFGGISSEPGAGPEGEDVFSDFDAAVDTGVDVGAEEADITTGGADFDERTVSDEISGPETGPEDTEAGLAGEFAVGEEGLPFEEPFAEPVAGSPVKAILIKVIAVVVAIGVGVAFQMFAWPSVSRMIGMGSDEPKLDPQIELGSTTRQKAKLTKELAEFKKVGDPEQVQALKRQVGETRDSQGAIEEYDQVYAAAKGKETAYDELLEKITRLEADLSKANTDIRNVRSETEDTRQRVVELAKQTKEEYERFRFELVRAELGARMLIELQMQDVESFQAEVAELEKRLSKLSAVAPAPDAPGGQ